MCLGKNGKLSVIMPVYRLGPVIAGNVARVCELLRGAIPFELIPVDDGSDDASRSELQRVAARHPEVLPVWLAQNAGKGAALRQGFARASGTHILLLDADLDLPPEQVTRFFQIMEAEKADIVIGSKRHPLSQIDYPWIRRLSSRVYYGLVKALIGLPVRDTQTGIKLFTRPALTCALDRMLVKRFAFDLEVLAIANRFGFRIAEAPVVLDFGQRLGCLSWRAVREVMHDTLAIFYRLRLLRYYQSVEPLTEPDTPPRFSVVIAANAPPPRLERCLKGLVRQRLPALEILIVTAPDAPPPPLIAPTIRLLTVPAASSITKRNAGIEQAKGDIIVFIDETGTPDEHWLSRAAGYFMNPAIAALGGPIIPAPVSGVRGRVAARVQAHRLVTGTQRFRLVPDRVRDVKDLPIGNLMVRRCALEAVGGMRTMHEPLASALLCFALRHDLKQRIVYDPWLIVHRPTPPLFLPFLRETQRHARCRGECARRVPRALPGIRPLLPTLLLACVAVGGVAAVFLPWLRLPYGTAWALYLGITLLGAFHRRPRLWLLTWLGILATHWTYALGFLKGWLQPEAETAAPSAP